MIAIAKNKLHTTQDTSSGEPYRIQSHDSERWEKDDSSPDNKACTCRGGNVWMTFVEFAKLIFASFLFRCLRD